MQVESMEILYEAKLREAGAEDRPPKKNIFWISRIFRSQVEQQVQLMLFSNIFEPTAGSSFGPGFLGWCKLTSAGCGQCGGGISAPLRDEPRCSPVEPEMSRPVGRTWLDNDKL